MKGNSFESARSATTSIGKRQQTLAAKAVKLAETCEKSRSSATKHWRRRPSLASFRGFERPLRPPLPYTFYSLINDSCGEVG